MGSLEVPCIDLSENDTSIVVKELLDACKNWGFVSLKNHGIPLDEIDRTFKLADEFFDIPVEEKQKYLFKGGRLHSGYTGHFGEKLDMEHQSRGDLKESYDLAGFPDPKLENLCPFIAEHMNEFLQFQRHCYKLTLRLLDFFAIGFGIPPDFFSKSHSSAEDVLRLLKYSIPEGVERREDDEDAGAHSDYGSITLLFQRDAAGLEIRPPNFVKDMDWIKVNVQPDVVLVNIADMLQFWTSGKLRSTVHRVRIDPGVKTRQTIAYFVTPDPETPLSPLFEEKTGKDIETVTAGEWIDGRINFTYGYSAPPKGYLGSQNDGIVA
ncbi:Iron/ascorbate oxidoreductase family protein [Schizosaccharomyces pombe]